MTTLEMIEELQKQVHTLANAVRKLAIEVRTNREFIEKSADLSKKTVEAVKFVSDEVKAKHNKNGYAKSFELSQNQIIALEAKGWKINIK